MKAIKYDFFPFHLNIGQGNEFWLGLAFAEKDHGSAYCYNLNLFIGYLNIHLGFYWRKEIK